MILKGRAFKFGDDIDTDAIIPARYLNTSDPSVLKEHCMEDADPTFSSRIAKGDIIVAGKNFGCGSSREHAPIAIKASGVSCVIALTFARIFFRNSFNMGLPIFESDEASSKIKQGDILEVDVAEGIIKNLVTGNTFKARGMPAFMQELIADGGLIAHIKKRGKI
ncbi:MAG: 3-isopropylmalate dehydratase small subunit [Thermodesulfobacteriota bacterium]|nr:3-isopropylmalate dehydratase small subunit [Thermodesulfobacteriota bacterium]